MLQVRCMGLRVGWRFREAGDRGQKVRGQLREARGLGLFVGVVAAAD
jgi:hypothetical protein